jgi:hypothetical protein
VAFETTTGRPRPLPRPLLPRRRPRHRSEYVTPRDCARTSEEEHVELATRNERGGAVRSGTRGGVGCLLLFCGNIVDFFDTKHNLYAPSAPRRLPQLSTQQQHAQGSRWKRRRSPRPRSILRTQRRRMRCWRRRKSGCGDAVRVCITSPKTLTPDSDTLILMP